MPDALVERDGQTMVITMNRPHRKNALSGSMLIRMYDAMVEASNDDDIRCIILTGAGGDFTSGADLKAMAGDAGDADPEIDVAARMQHDPDLSWKGLLRHYRPTKPLIAAVEGVAIAGGTEILQGTDIRVAGESARFGVSRGALVAVPDGRLGGSPPPPDPVHDRRRDPPHRQTHHRRRGAALRLDRPRRPRRSGAGEGEGDRGDDLRPAARSRSRPCSRRCTRPTA